MNPGVPSKHYLYSSMEKALDKSSLSQNSNSYRRCKKCNILIFKKMNVCHCNTCNICVMDHDHHCPWTGKCIGKYNFVGSVFSFFIMSFITFICSLINIVEN